MEKSIIIIVLLLVSFSCKKENDKVITKEYNGVVDLYKLPDTLYTGIDYIGDFEYNSSLDTIDLKIVKDRFVFLYLTSDSPENTEKGHFSSEDEIKKVNYKAFTIGEGKIVFTFKFTELGKKRLSWVIKDKILFKNDVEGDKIRIITKYYPYAKDLYIKDSSFIPKVSK